VKKGILKWIVLQAVFLLGFTCFYFMLRINQTISVADSSISTNSMNTQWYQENLSDCSNYIKLKKEFTQIYGIKFTENPFTKSITLQISATKPNLISASKINSTQEQWSVKVGKEEIVGNQYVLELYFQFRNVNEFEIYQDNNHIYIGYTDIRSIYKHVVLIDPGHGGIDSGTLSYNQKEAEKQVNLSVSKLLYERFSGDKVKVYMTRQEDLFLSPYDRADMINSLKPDLCISIHCNSGANKKAKGVEVLYLNKKEKDKFSSKRLAMILGEQITGITGQNHRELVPGNEIYIIKHSEVPIALIELGFLSNKSEMEFLINKENQKTIADGIYLGIEKALQEIE